MMRSPTRTHDIERSIPVSLNDACLGCRSGTPLPIDITMAFQPIVDIRTGRVFAYEALVRGFAGETAGEILSSVSAEMLYKFDQACRVEGDRAGRPALHNRR